MARYVALLGNMGRLDGLFMDTFHRSDRIKAHCIFEVVGRKVGIAHRHLDVGMAEDALQHQDIATVHHEVTGEGMTQNVSTLARGQCDASPSDCLLELGIAIVEQASSSPGQHGQ